MDRFFFSGSATGKLDDKNRFVLPQQMRYGLVENGELKFSVAFGLGGCLAIYRQSEMAKIVERFRAKQHVGKFQKFFTLFFSSLHELTCDKIGRVVLPSVLKKAIGIKSEIVIAGVLNKIEIWPKEVYDSHLTELFNGSGRGSEFSKLTEEAFALLEEENELQIPTSE
jgi:MraZ protein